MAPSFRLNVLGAFEARAADGRPAGPTSRKAAALLAYLAVESTHPHSREHLAALLWGDKSEERARHNLRQALSGIRRALGEVVVAREDTLCLDREACETDVDAFHRLTGGGDGGVDDLKAGVGLVRGALLEGCAVREPAFDEWLLMTRARLDRVAHEASDRLVEALVDAEQPAEAIEALEQRLAMDPACEPAHRQLMELLARVGRRSDALRQYQLCKAVLSRLLDTAPDDETTAVFDRLRQGDGADPARPARIGSRESAVPTVAVLPFENLSGDDDDYFVNGIIEDITTALSRFPSLAVIARGSAFRYADADLADRRVADELGAQYLVRGSVQRAGRRVRVNVRLVDAGAGRHVWGHRVDREIEDLFVLQDEITATLVSMLAGQVEAARLAQAKRAPPERLEAYDYVLRGKDHHHRFTVDDCRACMDMFERAIERDPTYALAYAWLACGIGQALALGIDDPSALVKRSEAACERGLELDENEAECHRVLAQVRLTRGNLERAVWHQERALFLNPNDDRSICSMGEFASYEGRHEEAVDWVRRSMRLNPYHPERYWTHLARPLLHLARFDETIEALGHISRLRRDDHLYRVAAGLGRGDEDAATSYAAEAWTAFPELDPPAVLASMPYRREADRELLAGTIAFMERVGAGTRASGST